MVLNTGGRRRRPKTGMFRKPKALYCRCDAIEKKMVRARNSQIQQTKAHHNLQDGDAPRLLSLTRGIVQAYVTTAARDLQLFPFQLYSSIISCPHMIALFSPVPMIPTVTKIRVTAHPGFRVGHLLRSFPTPALAMFRSCTALLSSRTLARSAGSHRRLLVPGTRQHSAATSNGTPTESENAPQVQPTESPNRGADSEAKPDSELRAKLKTKEAEVVDLTVCVFREISALSLTIVGPIEPFALPASRLSEPAAQRSPGEGANAGLCHYPFCFRSAGNGGRPHNGTKICAPICPYATHILPGVTIPRYNDFRIPKKCRSLPAGVAHRSRYDTSPTAPDALQVPRKTVRPNRRPI